MKSRYKRNGILDLFAALQSPVDTFSLKPANGRNARSSGASWTRVLAELHATKRSM
jgi:hypothetical protein